MDENSLRKLINNLISEVIEEDEELDEMNTTGSVGGEYMTPMAFTGGKKKKKKPKKNSYQKKIDEALKKEDLVQIRKLIKDTVGDILRDIWLKRNIWK